MIFRIKSAIYSIGLFVCILLMFGIKPVFALNLGDVCGVYESGPNECVTSCQRITTVVDGVVTADYCANGSTGSCQSNDSYCRFTNAGCVGFGYASLDCASISLQNCNSAHASIELKGCNYSDDGTPPPNDCRLVVGDGCYDYNCPEWGVGQGLGTNGCSSYQYYCVGSYWTGNCNVNPPPPPTPSCTVSLAPSTSTVSTGSQAQYVATVYPSNGTVSGVSFSSSSAGTSTVSPSSDTTVAYSTYATGVGVGTATITASVAMSGVVRCSTTAQVNVLPNDPWWQVGDSDVLTNGNIGSSVPTSLYFNLAGGGGFPGVAIYGGTTNLTSTKVSTKHWLANTSNTTNRVYGSSYFINSIPDSVTQNDISSSVFDQNVVNAGTPSSDGYIWFRYDGTTALDISTLSIGSNKVILIADTANININGNINLTKGSGFFLLVTKGRISVNSSVGGGPSNLEGIYISDGAFSSGTKKTSTVNDTKLSVRGTVAAYGGMNLQRDLGVGNASSPGEYFEYAPDLELLFPASLSSRVTNWREVAP